MRKLITTIAIAGVLGVAAISPSNAAPVPGFEGLYAEAFTACTPPNGTPTTCRAAIQALTNAMIAAGVDVAVALQSFAELRSEVRVAGGGDAIEAVFEELLPESGALGNAASPL
jgi:hypothetical protein